MAVNYTADDVIRIAKEQIGYLEKASNSNLDDKTANAGYKNYTKYARDLGATGMYNGGKQGCEWCDMFVDWCHVQAAAQSGGDWHDAQTALCQPDKGCGAGCYFSYNYYKAAGRASETPSIGAQIFFVSGGEVTHTGLVIDFDSNYVHTIEGNTSGASGVVISNGGGVHQKKYHRYSNNIYGYGMPKYADKATKVDEEKHDASVANGVQKFVNRTGADLDVYSGTRMDTKTGSLNPDEACYCFGKVWSKERSRWVWLVAYTLDDYPVEYKCGYVDHDGGTTF